MEQRLASQWAGYSWSDYLKLPGSENWLDPEKDSDSKAMILATYRLFGLMEAIKNDFPTKGK